MPGPQSSGPGPSSGGTSAPSSGITNSAGANVVPKSNGTNLVASRIQDDGVTTLQINSGAGTFEAGDTGGISNNLRLLISNSGNTASLGDVESSGVAFVYVNKSSSEVELGGFTNNTLLTVNDAAKTIAATASTESLAIDGVAHTATIASAAKTNLNAATGVNTRGTNTNDSAASGYVGELLTASLASGSATSLTTATAKTLISLSLTAGDWDVWGVADYVPAATTTTAVVAQGISQTDNTIGAQDTFTACSGGNLTGTVLGSLIAEATPLQRISLAGTTTVYLVGKATFAVSTLTAYGSIFARRRR